MERDLFTTDRIFCPGPTPVPKAALDAAAATSIYHRTDEFYKIFRGCLDRLQPIFGCSELPVILASSGTGGLEAAMQNLTDVGDEIVVVNGGKFGERWEKLGLAYQCKVEAIKIPWGTKPDVAMIKAAIAKQAKTKAVFLQGNETSTGAYYGIETLVPELRKSFDGLVVVDAISSLGAHAMKMDAWKIDCVVAGSQKGFGIPAGLAFVALSKRGWQSLSKRPKFYFDLAKEAKGQAEGRSAWTPANSLIMSLSATLDIMHDAGLDNVLKHHEALAKATRAAVKAIGLEVLPKDAPSNALTAAVLPAGIDGSKLIKQLRQRFATFFAGGQDELKGKVVRLAHLGFVSRFDLIDCLAAFEFGLAEAGYKFDLGAGVKAAMQSLSGHR
jgi:aspartate aminotransferase-like enzyme